MNQVDFLWSIKFIYIIKFKRLPEIFVVLQLGITLKIVMKFPIQIMRSSLVQYIRIAIQKEPFDHSHPVHNNTFGVLHELVGIT